jgi:hypothetical protein
MPASRRIIESSQGSYRTAALDAAVERQARRDQGGAPAPSSAPRAPRGTGVSLPYRKPTSAPHPAREAHLESTGASRRGNSLTRERSADVERTLAQADYRGALGRQLVPGIDNTALLDSLAELNEKYRIAGAKAGLLGAPSQLEAVLDALGRARDKWGSGGPGGIGGFDGAGPDWDIGGLLGRTGHGGSPQNPTGGTKGPTAGDFGGGSWGGMLPSGANAMDPKSPTGRGIGGSHGGGGSPFGDVGRHAQAGWRGLERGFSLGQGGPSGAEMSGTQWEAFHPGRDASEKPDGAPDEPKEPKKPKKPDAGTDGGAGATPGAPDSPTGGPHTPAMPPAGNAPMTPPVVAESKAGPSAGTVALALGGSLLGAAAGMAVGWYVIESPVATVVLGLGGMAAGGIGGAKLAKKWGLRPPEDGHRPPEDGHRPPEDGHRRFTSPDAPGTLLYRPNPDDPSPGGPRSRQAAFGGAASALARE